MNMKQLRSRPGKVTGAGLALVEVKVDSVIVPDNAASTLVGSSAKDLVMVGASALLPVPDPFITGNLIGEGTATLSIIGASSGVISAQVQGGGQAFIYGVTIDVSPQIDTMAGKSSASGAHAGGNAQEISSRDTASPARDSRLVMQRLNELHAPVGSENMAAQKARQCAGL
jgi:hypothetical protein